MDFNQFLDLFYLRSGLSKVRARRYTNLFVQCLKDALLENDEVRILRFGRFRVMKKKVKSKDFYRSTVFFKVFGSFRRILREARNGHQKT